jgi:hypothetical protein
MRYPYLFGRPFVVAILALLILPQGSEAQITATCSTCPSGRAEYRTNPIKQSWEAHRLAAHDMGCELASIKSPEEQVKATEAIQNILYLQYDQYSDPDAGVAYIGGTLNSSDLTDPRVGHYTFTWVDRSAPFEISRGIQRPNSYTNFGSQDAMKDFLALQLGYVEPGEWLDWTGTSNNAALYKCCAPVKQCEGTKKYRFSPIETDWGTHKTKAEELGCVLASIKSPEEQAAAEAELGPYIGFPYQYQYGFYSSFIFIGAEVVSSLTDPEAGNYTFEWTDGSGQFQYVRGSNATTTPYTNFHPGDPNGGTDYFWGEGYLALSMDEHGSVGIPRGKWVDFSAFGGPALYQCCDVPEPLAYAQCKVA